MAEPVLIPTTFTLDGETGDLRRVTEEWLIREDAEGRRYWGATMPGTQQESALEPGAPLQFWPDRHPIGTVVQLCVPIQIEAENEQEIETPTAGEGECGEEPPG